MAGALWAVGFGRPSVPPRDEETMERVPMAGSRDEVAREILELFAARGDSNYGGEAVTQRAHALQAAHLARQAGAGPALVVAALVHDVGHLLHDLPEDAPDQGLDDCHEELAARWLAGRFGPEVVEPVRLHVAAKRCLCAIEPGYFEALSEPSKQSLRLQGGPMPREEAEAFAASPRGAAAILLRRCDDGAKVAGLEVPGLETHVEAIAKVARGS
jgi:phosphonate degradation associated HDIG domain protein